MPAIFDVEQLVLLLALEPPFDKQAVQLARRRMAKRWHPDLAPQGRQFEHERHLKAINQAADQLERLAEGSRGGRVSSSARVPARRSALVTIPLPAGCRTTRSSTATRAAWPIRSGAWAP